VVRYADAREGEPHSGHVALLGFVALEGRVLGVANTHVRWDAPETPPEAQVGLRQVRELATALGGADGWVVCGDFNATLQSPALEVLLAAGFRDPHEAEAFTFNSAAEPRKIDFLLTSEALHAEAVAPRRIEALTPLPSSAEPSDHLALVAEVSWRAG
jgi:endonuclease/exonuclease/phosphatase family metal-dependent hydrolase